MHRAQPLVQRVEVVQDGRGPVGEDQVAIGRRDEGSHGDDVLLLDAEVDDLGVPHVDPAPHPSYEVLPAIPGESAAVQRVSCEEELHIPGRHGQ